MKQLLDKLRTIPLQPLFVVALMLVLIYLVMRDIGTYPTVFGDEWTYSSYSRLTPFRQTLLPSYLYFSLFGITAGCGDSFLACARVINAVLFVAAAPFIYTIARRIASGPVAAAVALLSIAGPANSYTAYFMPEAMYFLAFWMFSAAVFAFFERQSWRRLLVGAVLLGLMAMIKVHALFLVPGYCCFLLYAAYAQRDAGGAARWMRRGLALAAVALLVALAVRLAAGYLFAGRHGLDLLGQMYTNQASEHAGVGSRIPLALGNLAGHALALALLAGLPLAAFVLHGSHAALRARAGKTATAVLMYALLMLGVLLAVTVLFTAAVAGHGSESSARLHMRYYDFALPLFLIFAGSHITRALPAVALHRKLLAALPLAALIVVAYLKLLPAFRPIYVDSPALYGYTADPDWFDLLTGVALLALAVWVVDLRRGAQLFVFVFTPLFAVTAGGQVNNVLRTFLQPDANVRAGIFARHYLTASEIERLTIVGDDASALFKTRFFIDSTHVQLLILPQGQPIAANALPAGPHSLLLIGDYPAPPNMVSRVARRDFALLQSAPDPREAYAINFAAPDPDRERVRVQGLSDQEPWGRWSNAKTVRIEFGQPLPREMSLRLDARAFGPNTQDDFVVRIGQQARTVRLSEQRQTVRLPFHTSGSDRLISIEVPHPASPSRLGQGADARELGIALYSMAVDSGAGEDAQAAVAVRPSVDLAGRPGRAP